MKLDPATLCLLFTIALLASVIAGGVSICRMSGNGFVASWMASIVSLVAAVHYGRRAE